MTSIGILGAGMIANVHAEMAASIGTTVVAVHDPSDERAVSFGEKHKCEVVNSKEELISRNDIDGIVIATPNDQHASLAIEALQADKHVLLEKPMAMSLAQCDEIIAARDASGRVLGRGRGRLSVSGAAASSGFVAPVHRLRRSAAGCTRQTPG